MTAFALGPRDLTAAMLGVASGFAVAAVAAPWAGELWAFFRRGYEAGLFAFFLC